MDEKRVCSNKLNDFLRGEKESAAVEQWMKGLIKMDKAILTQMASIKKEIKDLEREIMKMRARLSDLKDERVKDTVRGTRADLTIGPISVTGKPQNEYHRKKMALIGKLSILEQKKAELERTEMEAEEYINAIEDSEMRRIIRYRCIEDLSWQQVAMRMGRKYTEDGCRMRFKRFMENE